MIEQANAPETELDLVVGRVSRSFAELEFLAALVVQASLSETNDDIVAVLVSGDRLETNLAAIRRLASVPIFSEHDATLSQGLKETAVRVGRLKEARNHLLHSVVAHGAGGLGSFNAKRKFKNFDLQSAAELASSNVEARRDLVDLILAIRRRLNTMTVENDWAVLGRTPGGVVYVRLPDGDIKTA